MEKMELDIKFDDKTLGTVVYIKWMSITNYSFQNGYVSLYVYYHISVVLQLSK